MKGRVSNGTVLTMIPPNFGLFIFREIKERDIISETDAGHRGSGVWKERLIKRNERSPEEK